MSKLLGLVLAVGLTVGGWAGAAGADELVIRTVDTRDLPAVEVTVRLSGAERRPAELQVREDGRLVPGARTLPIGETDTEVGVVLVVDASAAMTTGGRLDGMKAAAHAFIAQNPPFHRMAVVSAGSAPRLVADFTSDRAVLAAAVNGLSGEGRAALWDGARLALEALGRRPDLQPNVVLLAGGADEASLSGLSEVRASAASTSTAVFVVALGQATANPALLDLARITGGLLQTANEQAAVSGALAQVAGHLAAQYKITYASQMQQPVLLEVTAGPLRAATGVPPHALVSGVGQPQAVGRSGVPAALEGDRGRLAAAALAAVALGTLGYVAGAEIARRRSRPLKLLEPYSWEPDRAELRPEQITLATTTAVRNFVAVAARVADRVRLLPRVAAALEEAAVPLRASEALFFALAAASLLGVYVAVATGSVGSAGAVFTLAVLAPRVILRARAARRRRAYQAQLPDVLRMLAGAMRSGFSLPQAMQSVAVEVDEPMGGQLRRAVAQIQLGQSIERALTDAGQRMRSEDWNIAVTAIRIQREVGGNISELLNRVADTMVSRDRLRQEVKALTAEGRISAIVLGLLPVGIGTFMYTINPEYIRVLFTTSLGRTLMLGSGLLALMGFFWIKKTVRVEL